jgi:hypothetical protein
MPSANYVQLIQHEIDFKMRTTLVSWIMQVHNQFKLLPETLYLTINLIDRFLSIKPVSPSKLQLVGIVCLLIASKYEEICAPCVSDLVYITDNAYNRNEILAAERYILGEIKFQIGYPNPLNFLRHISKVDGLDRVSRTLAKYLCQVTLLDPYFLQFPSSIIAGSATYVAIKVVKNGHWVIFF